METQFTVFFEKISKSYLTIEINSDYISESIDQRLKINEVTMKKNELLNLIDEELIGKLYGFCYDRTDTSHDAEELCSDIIYALVKSGNADGEIDEAYAFIWQVARNTYADYSEKRKREQQRSYENDPDKILMRIPYREDVDTSYEDKRLLSAVYRQIAFLSRAYREVMIAYYLDGKPIALIASEQKTSETAVRQRLFSARDTIRKGVNTMEKNTKPLAFEEFDLDITGTGDPRGNDPREVMFRRRLSKQVVWLCKGKEMSAKAISEALNVPTAYIEDELDIQTRGLNGKYGLLKKLSNGKYTVNFILLDENEVDEAQRIYIDSADEICSAVAEFLNDYKDEYLAFPYLNKNVDMNLIMWKVFYNIANHLGATVREKLEKKHFELVKPSNRPFSVYGNKSNGKYWDCGSDGIEAENVCGCSYVYVSNIYMKPLRRKFSCGHNISTDQKLQLAIRALDGISVDTLDEEGMEIAAKAIKKGYIYRDGDVLRTAILTVDAADSDRFLAISKNVMKYLDPVAERIAEKVAVFIRNNIPKHLWSDYKYANSLAAQPMFEMILDSLIEKGMLTIPEEGFSSEGMYMELAR